MPVIYIGKPSKHVGKTLFEILCNLKNFGIGRMVIRSHFHKYKEPSYYIIKKVEPQMDPENKWGYVWTESVFRGRKFPELEKLDSTFLPDFQLIPKDDEHTFLENKSVMAGNILPPDMEFPPLMSEILRIDKNLPKDKPPRLPLTFKDSYANASRVAAEGETPTIDITLAPNINPKLLKNVTPI